MKTKLLIIGLIMIFSVLIMGFISAANECVETDNGKNYYNRGNVNPSSCVGSGASCGVWADRCINSTTLLEYYCDGDNFNDNFEYYDCENGCLNGACIMGNADCNTLYWVDDNNRNCEQKEFCGMYMYQGLFTFENKKDCEDYVLASSGNIIEEDYSCKRDSDCKLVLEGCPVCDDCKTHNLEDDDVIVVNKSYSCAAKPDDVMCVACVGSLNFDAIKDVKCFNNKCEKLLKQNNDSNNNGGGRDNENFPGQGKVKILPEIASQRARERLGELGFNITLKEVGQNKTVYFAEAEKEVRFLGLFKTKAKVSAEIDAETGEVVKVKKPWWAFLAKDI